jgi:hypothetical protein
MMGLQITPHHLRPPTKLKLQVPLFIRTMRFPFWFLCDILSFADGLQYKRTGESADDSALLQAENKDTKDG